MSDLDGVRRDTLPLTGQNLLDVPYDGISVKTAVFRADLTRRPDVRGWLRSYRKGMDTQALTSWVCRPDLDPPMALFIVTAGKPHACRFALALNLTDGDAWRWIERIAMAGFIGLTDQASAASPQELLSQAVLLPFNAQPLRDMLESVR